MHVGVGTELKRILRRFGITPTPNCPCDERALVMNLEGPQWCRANISIITGWLQEEANNRKLPFSKIAARILIRVAIHKAEKKLRIMDHA